MALRNHGGAVRYHHDEIGVNSRLDEIQAAVLDVKLKYLDEDNKHRQQIAACYYEIIKNNCITLPDRLPDVQNVYHLFPILCTRRDELQEYLKANGVGTVIHYPIPPHKQECYKEWNDRNYPITEIIHDQELSIPTNQVLRIDDAKKVVDVLNLFM